MQLTLPSTLQISRVKPGNPRREGGKEGRREGMDVREGWTDEKEGWVGGRKGYDGNCEVGVYMAWNGCIKGNPSEAG